MNLIAYYLPQFHEIEENNRAWGEGFTEWSNVKKSVSLFEGHYQPREPLHDNYYNLLNPDVMRWQILLAQQYGVYGFCFYHYWFRDGKRVLEKPAEILLEHKDLDMPFCFSWANEPWTKTWHGAAGEKEVLIEQRYGKQKQWKQHFDYLLPFFQDKRYIHIDNKPVFLIYQINKIGCFNQMIDYWNHLANENGIESIYIIDMLTLDGKKSYNKRVSAYVDFEPGKAKRRSVIYEKGAFCHMKSWDDEYRLMLTDPHKKNEFRCMFVDYDDTPRRGSRGYVYEGSSPEKFGQYLQKTIELSQKEGNEYVFINAWNEWGESNYLEPDKKYKYAYLEQIQLALQGKCRDIEIEQSHLAEDVDYETRDKHKAYYNLCNRWIKAIHDGYRLDEYFLEKGYRNIAVYGMGELGNRLIEELNETDIIVQYGINKDMWEAFAEIDIKGLEEEAYFDGVDCIVVTPIHLFEEIKQELEKKCDCIIISLEDVIAGL